MIEAAALLAASLLAAAQPAATAAPATDYFRIACGERECLVENRDGAFRVTRGNVRAVRIGDRGAGAHVRLRLESDGEARTVAITVASAPASPRETVRGGTSLGNLVEPLSRAGRVALADCTGSDGAACTLVLRGLDTAVDSARGRLTVARRRW